MSEAAKWALITGATGGLGREMARQLAAKGWSLVLHGRNAEALMALAGETAREGAIVRTVTADLATTDGPATLVAEVDALGIEVDLLVNNAGLGYTAQFVESDLDRQRSARALPCIWLAHGRTRPRPGHERRLRCGRHAGTWHEHVLRFEGLRTLALRGASRGTLPQGRAGHGALPRPGQHTFLGSRGEWGQVRPGVIPHPRGGLPHRPRVARARKGDLRPRAPFEGLLRIRPSCPVCREQESGSGPYRKAWLEARPRGTSRATHSQASLQTKAENHEARHDADCVEQTENRGVLTGILVRAE